MAWWAVVPLLMAGVLWLSVLVGVAAPLGEVVARLDRSAGVARPEPEQVAAAGLGRELCWCAAVPAAGR